MKKTLIFGHKNPDTDTICSAISLARLKKELGMEVEAVRLGEINEETQFVLEYFRVEKPRLIRSASIEVDQVILVDHNEFQHSVDDIEKVKILEVVDHHRISNFQTADALYFRCEPIGSTATIITKMYREKGVNIPKDIAGLLLSAIISDTLLFKSPTCTDEDVLIAKQLAKIVEVDLEDYGLKLLKAGTNLSGKTVEQLITLDAKEFQMDSHKILIAQVNTVDVDEVYERQIELEEVMRKTIREQGLSLFLFSATNILKGYSTALALGNLSGLVEEAFKVKLDNNKAKLKGVVSRKKQLIPMITNAYEKNK